MNAKPMTPTDEQLDIINLIENSNDNILVNALPGTGKTTTLDLVQSASPQQPVLCLAFNKRIAEAMEDKFGGSATCKTFNSLCHRIWSSTVGKVTLDPKKTQTQFKEAISDLTGGDRDEAWDAYWEVSSAVGLAKSVGYIPEGKYANAKRLITREAFHASLEEAPSPLVAEIIDAVLLLSIKTAYNGLIDFNDQVYMPALFGGSFPRFAHVLVDEDQDMSPVNHAVLDKLCRNSRLTAVGDRWQSIYAFRGAVTDGVERLKERFNMHEAGLTTSFRCPQAIVENARWRAPDFKWIKPGGKVEELTSITTKDFVDGSAIICRNNAPLFRLAFQLLSDKRSVQVAGSDIGPRVINTLKKIGSDDDTTDALMGKIDDWRDEKLAKAQNSQAYIYDMAECMKIFASFGKTLSLAIAYAKDLFARQGTLHLTTGHKAKGLEWDVVYFLDPWLIKDAVDEQEKNLRFVIQTRAKDRLTMINSKDVH